jgi:adenine-specific DNA-methyltransferase
MSADEAKGLAAYLNSPQVDAYLRRVSGNTQVNAADLRSVPLPSMSVLLKIGAKLPTASSLTEADVAVGKVLGARKRAAIA